VTTNGSNGSPDLRASRRAKARYDAPKLDRLPPHSPEAEQGVLGCIFLSPNDCLAECASRFKDETVFYDLRHQTIYQTLIELAEADIGIDIIMVQQHLKERQMLEQVGGVVYLASLPDMVPSAANLLYYVEIVLEKDMLRRMIHTCTDIVGRVYEHEGEAEQLVDEFEREALTIRSNTTSTIMDAPKLVRNAIDSIEKMHARGGVISGMETGFLDLDKLTDGMHGGEMIVVSGFTSTGKTSLAMNIAEHVAVDLRKPVGVFSLEMSADQLGQRMLCSRARVNLRNIREGYMAERDFPKLTGSAGKINMGTLWVCDDTEQTVGQLRAKARRMRQQFNIELWIVDYLQLLTHPSARRGDTQEQEMDAIGKALKFMAREFNAPVIVISQLNDEGKLSRCRAIGHHADVLLKLRFEEKADRSEPIWPMVLGIEKQRNGPTGDVRLTFIRDFTRFESAAKVSDEDYKS